VRKLISTTFGLYLAAAGVAHGQEGRVLPAPQPSRTVMPAPTANEKLAIAIAERLRANDRLKHYHVDVEVTDGVVELTGQVADAKQRDEVLRNVRQVRGVNRVRDHLAIGEAIDVPALPTSKSPAKSAPVEVTETVVPAAPVAGARVQTEVASVQTAAAPVQPAPMPAPAPQIEAAPVQTAAPPAQLAPLQVASPQPEMAPVQMAPFQMAPIQMGQYPTGPVQMVPVQMAPMNPWGQVQMTAQPGMAPRAGMPPEPLPIFMAQPGMPNPQLQPPPMPPHAWPTYAPYNNVSRVAYPNNYPYEAWPFIGPMYPFPKVPLGWRSVTLSWRDGYWWYGREASGHDWWRVRYW